MTSKELLQQALAHSQPERIVFDMGSTAVTGIHVRALEKLRMYYGLEKRPVHVIEPYQMLGLVEPDLMDAIGVDVTGAWGEENLLGYNNNPPLKLFKTFWGQEVLVPEKFSTVTNEKGELLSFPDGDKSVDASAKMPESGYFFDAIDRQQPIDEDKLNVEDNLEEFSLISSKTLSYWRQEVARAKSTGKAIVAGFGGTALGDIALVPAMNLKNPKGIRNIEEWYISTMLRSEYVREIFDRQSALAVENLRRIFTTVGNDIDVVFICGTDFGTQNSSFCAPEQFDDLWLPYYKRLLNIRAEQWKVL
jgi:hypothetical protein